MRYLQTERETLERYLPGLDGELAAQALCDLEQPDGQALKLFKKTGGPGLLVPT